MRNLKDSGLDCRGDPDETMAMIEGHIIVHEPNISKDPVVLVVLGGLDPRVTDVEDPSDDRDAFSNEVLAPDSELVCGCPFSCGCDVSLCE